MEKIDKIIGKHSDEAFRGIVIEILNKLIDWKNRHEVAIREFIRDCEAKRRVTKVDNIAQCKRICSNCHSIVSITIPAGVTTDKLEVCPVCECSTLRIGEENESEK